MNVRDYNRAAWDREVGRGNEWTVPVSAERIEAARRGEWEILLTETKPVPRQWFPQLKGRDVLCLASGGGQQAPILAATGARVTVYDNSPKQLEQDRLVAARDSLDLKTVEGDMADLSAFAGESFDLVFHPVSNLFVPEVRPVWRETFRVLRRGGILLAGFLNPSLFIFGSETSEHDKLEVRYTLPYSDLKDMPGKERDRLIANEEPFEFSHTLEDQLGGQLDAGFHLTGLYEDRHRELRIARFMPTYIATRALKP
ncbi:MAG: class I SAM-dependent methyltransferase [Acidobacteria bacterium]|nr:class I SAM-dependent methyltransferase [Acidobacteriota bacterium]